MKKCLSAIAVVLLAALLTVAGRDREHMTHVLDSLSRLSDRELLESATRHLDAGERTEAEHAVLTVCARYRSDLDREHQQIAANCFNYYGMLLSSRGAYSPAIDNYMKARRIVEKYGPDSIRPLLYSNIGNVYAWNKDYPTALEYFRMALPLCPRHGNGTGATEGLKAMLLNNIMAANYFLGNRDSMQYYAQRYAREVPHTPRYHYDLLLNNAFLLELADKPGQAIDKARQAAAYALEHKLPALCTGAAYSTIASLYEKTGQLDSAALYYRKSADISTGRSLHLKVDALRDIARIYTRMGRQKEAMECMSEYVSLSDSLGVQETRDNLLNAQSAYELESSAEKINDLRESQHTQLVWIIVLVAFVVVCIAFIAILIHQKHTLNKAWKELYEQNRRQLEAPAIAPRKVVTDDHKRQEIARGILRVMEETDEYCSPDFSVERLASLIDSNARYVSEVLNDVIGKNFRTLLNEYRIRKAMMRLDDPENYGNLTIKAISESVGYKSQSTFISVFTNITGLKPSIYLRLSRERAASPRP